MRWIKSSSFQISLCWRQSFPGLREVWWKASHGTVPHIFRKIVKTTKTRGFGQPSFLMQNFFRIFRMELFFVSKRAEWVRVRETEYLLIFACHFLASIQHQGELWIQGSQKKWEQMVATTSCGHLAQTSDALPFCQLLKHVEQPKKQS